MNDKLKLRFSKRDDLTENTKIELFNLIDSIDQTFLEKSYNDYLTQRQNNENKTHGGTTNTVKHK